MSIPLPTGQNHCSGPEQPETRDFSTAPPEIAVSDPDGWKSLFGSRTAGERHRPVGQPKMTILPPTDQNHCSVRELLETRVFFTALPKIAVSDPDGWKSLFGFRTS